MPYISKTEREWITLKEAILHIQRIDGCDECTALRQLRKALGDEAVKARHKIRVSDPYMHPIEHGSEHETDFPRIKFWLTIPIDLQGDGCIVFVSREDFNKTNGEDEWEAFDEDFGPFGRLVTANNVEANFGCSWPLFISWSSIRSIWGDYPDDIQRANINLPPSEAVVGEGTGNRTQVNASESTIRQALSAIYDEAQKAGTRPPNAAEAFDLLKKQLAPKSVSRDRARPIIKEFEDRRWGPGQRSAKK
jgi:hypothetical protein